MLEEGDQDDPVVDPIDEKRLEVKNREWERTSQR